MFEEAVKVILFPNSDDSAVVEKKSKKEKKKDGKGAAGDGKEGKDKECLLQ